MNTELPPHASVEVRFSNDDYLNVCVEYGGGDDLLDQWKAIGDLLAHRPGWHFDVVNDGEALWSLGAFGASMLNIQVNRDRGFDCFDYAEDESVTVADCAAVEEWLEQREEKARRPTDLTLEILSDQDWRGLRQSIFDVRVTWSDGWYSAIVRGLPEPPTFGETLPAVIQAARLLLVQAVGAPTDVASELRLRVRIEPDATNRLANDGAGS